MNTTNIFWIKVKNSSTLKAIFNSSILGQLRKESIYEYGKANSFIFNKYFDDKKSFWVHAKTDDDVIELIEILAEEFSTPVMAYWNKKYAAFNSIGKRINIESEFENDYCLVASILEEATGYTFNADEYFDMYNQEDEEEEFIEDQEEFDECDDDCCHDRRSAKKFKGHTLTNDKESYFSTFEDDENGSEFISNKFGSELEEDKNNSNDDQSFEDNPEDDEDYDDGENIFYGSESEDDEEEYDEYEFDSFKYEDDDFLTKDESNKTCGSCNGSCASCWDDKEEESQTFMDEIHNVDLTVENNNEDFNYNFPTTDINNISFETKDFDYNVENKKDVSTDLNYMYQPADEFVEEPISNTDDAFSKLDIEETNHNVSYVEKVEEEINNCNQTFDKLNQELESIKLASELASKNDDFSVETIDSIDKYLENNDERVSTEIDIDFDIDKEIANESFLNSSSNLTLFDSDSVSFDGLSSELVNESVNQNDQIPSALKIDEEFLSQIWNENNTDNDLVDSLNLNSIKSFETDDSELKKKPITTNLEENNDVFVSSLQNLSLEEDNFDNIEIASKNINDSIIEEDIFSVDESKKDVIDNDRLSEVESKFEIEKNKQYSTTANEEIDFDSFNKKEEVVEIDDNNTQNVMDLFNSIEEPSHQLLDEHFYDNQETHYESDFDDVNEIYSQHIQGYYNYNHTDGSNKDAFNSNNEVNDDNTIELESFNPNSLIQEGLEENIASDVDTLTSNILDEINGDDFEYQSFNNNIVDNNINDVNDLVENVSEQLLEEANYQQVIDNNKNDEFERIANDIIASANVNESNEFNPNHISIELPSREFKDLHEKNKKLSEDLSVFLDELKKEKEMISAREETIVQREKKLKEILSTDYAKDAAKTTPKNRNW